MPNLPLPIVLVCCLSTDLPTQKKTFFIFQEKTIFGSNFNKFHLKYAAFWPFFQKKKSPTYLPTSKIVSRKRAN